MTRGRPALGQARRAAVDPAAAADRASAMLRVLGAGVVWAAVYNVLWGLAWVAFIRREWTDAAAARSGCPSGPR